jgi:hypothetical protein
LKIAALQGSSKIPPVWRQGVDALMHAAASHLREKAEVLDQDAEPQIGGTDQR